MMIYGLGILVGTVVGFAGVASLSVSDHPPAPRVPSEAVGLSSADFRPVLSGSPSIESSTHRTLVRNGATDAFGRPDAVPVFQPLSEAPSQPVSQPHSGASVADSLLPVGEKVMVHFGSSYKVGTIEAADDQWIQLATDGNVKRIWISRAIVSMVQLISSEP